MTAAGLFVIYATLPGSGRSSGATVAAFSVMLLLLAVLIVVQVRAILKADYPGMRAFEALATIIPFFFVTFSLVYLEMSQSDVHTFSLPLDHIRALYFTVVVFSTVGFGDVVAKTDPARLVVTIQIVLDLILIGIVTRLIFGAVQRRRDRPSGT